MPEPAIISGRVFRHAGNFNMVTQLSFWLAWLPLDFLNVRGKGL